MLSEVNYTSAVFSQILRSLFVMLHKSITNCLHVNNNFYHLFELSLEFSDTLNNHIMLFLVSFKNIPPLPNSVDLNRNSLSFKFWHIGPTGTVRCQEHIVQHMAFVIGRHNSICLCSILCSYIFMLIKANTWSSYLQMHVWIYDKYVVWNKWIMSAFKRKITIFKTYNYTAVCR